MTPILPYPEDSLVDGTTVVTVDEVSSDDAVRDIFDTAYPEEATGSAWVVPIGNKIFISNGHENSDIAQNFSIEIAGWGTLSGIIQPHSYAILTATETEIWMMANGDTKGPYTDDRSTHIAIQTDSEPTLEIMSGDIDSTWNEEMLSVSISHANGAGKVRFLR